MVHHNGSFRGLQKAVVPNSKTISSPNAMNYVLSFINNKKGLETCFKEIWEAVQYFHVITYCDEKGPCFNPFPHLSTLVLKGRRKKQQRRQGRGGKKDLIPESLFEVFVLLIKSSQFGKT